MYELISEIALAFSLCGAIIATIAIAVLFKYYLYFNLRFVIWF